MRPGYFVVTLVLGLAMLAAAADDMPLQAYSYREGFEGDAPKVVHWAKNGPSTVEFIGPSEEMAFEGKKSLKLDVSLEGGSYHYFGVILRPTCPCVGKLKISAQVYVAEGTTARVGFGTNMQYPPTRHSGCGFIKSFDKPTGKWELVEDDMVARAREGKAQVMANYAPTAKGEDVGAYLDRWSLFIYGGKGKRAIVYVDDVRIEGEVPSRQDYEKDIKARWAKGQEHFGERVAGWRAQLTEAQEGIAKMPEPPEDLREAVEALNASTARAQELIDKIVKTGYGSKGEVDAIQAALSTVKFGPETISAIAEATAAKQPYLIYAPRAITNARMTATTFPIPARVAKELSCAGCRGEYESVSVAIYALEDLKGLLVTASDLNGPAGTIPAKAVDICGVKSWYQAGRSISDKSHKMLVPELLLKDDKLVRVDEEKGENYVRSTAEDGTETYLLCSGKTSDNLKDVRPIDTDELQPVDIPAKSLKQFWLTVHIPDDAAPGTYEGRLSFKMGAGAQDIPLKLTVHPFELLPSRLIYSIYYRAKLSQDGMPTITSEYKSEEQYEAEIADLKAHGVLYPTNYQGWDNVRLPLVLEIRQDVGMPTECFYNLGRGTGSTTDPAALAGLQRDVKKWIELCKSFGYEEVYFYGIDEARGDRLAAQKATWGAVQEAGGKTFVACYYKTFEAMGELLNCAVLAGRPDPEEAKKWHSVGSHAFTYAYPQVGNEEPETYRRNFGLVLWKAGFDGAMDYAYQHGFGHVWNDFDSKSYRDHNFTYPTVNGVVGTIQWDGFREAVDDVRYATTLEAAIKNAPEAKKDIAKEAQEWLYGLDPTKADLYEVREGMVEWIGRLQ